MRTWTAKTTTTAHPTALIDVLTDPDAARRWAPVAFDVDDLEGRRLRKGVRARISGRLAGQSVGFDVEVHEADERGPVGFDVAYQLTPTDAGSEVHASIAVHPNRGLAGRLLAEATGALLTAGALETAVSRLVREAAAA